MIDIPKPKLDAISNALSVGMTPEDAFIYAELTPDELEEASTNPTLLARWQYLGKSLEFALLDNVRLASLREVSVGKSESTRWLLEKLYPRYSAKQAGTSELPIHLHIDQGPLPAGTMQVVAPVASPLSPCKCPASDTTPNEGTYTA